MILQSSIKKSGFSLIELIVTITIIAVLTVVAVVSFSSTNVRARDSRRVADVEKIRLALEMVRQVGVTYPVDKTVLVSGGYLKAWPDGPKNDSYDYVRSTNYSYTLDAHVEDLGNTTMPGVSGCGSVCNYRVTQP